MQQINAIDLGLSVLWGDRNLEASKPERSGGLFTWIEATHLSNGLDIAGRLLEPGWRLPTYEEVEELLVNRYEPIYTPFIFGIRVFGKNGNSIFLPSTNIELREISTLGLYWTSTEEEGMEGYGSQFSFDLRGVYGGFNKKLNPQSIRPVFDKKFIR